jgi:hypothetical protein|tara:strand:- start:1198 stop:1833 length:636 start_codon:yes stop_codon:yes gene_type:complete
MKPFVDRQRKYMEAQKAARDERAAEERKFMTSFNPNTAERKDFTRFRENLKRQAMEAAGPTQGGIFSSQQGRVIDKLYHEPYRKMMGQYLKTNPKDYAENFPISFGIQRALPMAAKGIMGAVSGIPMLGQMLPEQTNELLGDLSYLDYRPNRLMNLPEGFSFGDNNQALLELIEQINPYEANYRQFFPMQVPDYFYQFMDNEMLPYIMGMR